MGDPSLISELCRTTSMSSKSKVERFASPGKGNGLRARRTIKAGELVYAAEPLASCVSNKLSRHVCHHCFTRQDSLLRCSQCKMARYCSTTCQKHAWSAHKRECTCLKNLLPRIPCDSVRLAARIIFNLSSSQSNSEELYTLEEHKSHLSSMSDQRTEGLAQLASMLQLYLQQEVNYHTPELTSALPPSCQDPLGLIAKVTCNCFTISDAELQEIGVGLYPSLSLLNHNCRPNCVMMFEKTKLNLRAIKDIAPEEELTISYLSSLSVVSDRQTQLNEQYNFTCSCQTCNSTDMDGTMLSGEEASWCHLKESIPRLEKLQTDQDWRSVLDGCTDLLSANTAVPDHNIYKLRITDLALDACINLAYWEKALVYGVKTLPAYRLYYPDFHPVHGIQLMRVGKIQHYLGHIRDAMATLTQAYDIIKITHGNDQPLTTELFMKLEECRAEMDHAS